jgi:hypothetical protein
MPLVLKDRVKETSTTTGTGTLTLGGAATGFQSFAVIGNGNTTYYAIFDRTSQAWEVGVGTYTLSGTTLSRDTVLESSNSGSLVNFGAGTKDVFCTYPAEKAVTLDDIQTLTNKTLTNPTINGFTGNTAAITIGTNQIIKDTSGNVGLGITPTQRLHVSGNILATGSIDCGTQFLGLSTDTATAPSFSFTGDTNTGMFSPGADQAAITTGGTARLTVTTAQFTGTLPWRGQNGTAAAPALSASGDTNTGIYFPAADTIAFAEGGVESMRLDSNGNVGIGTSSPASRLAVAGGLRVGTAVDASYVRVAHDTANGLIDTNVGALGYAVPSSQFHYWAVGGSERMRIDSAGNVGIGTSSPAGKLAVSTGDGRKQFVVNTSTDPVVQIGIPDWYNVGSLAFINGSGGERMRIDSAGNVGIGTSTPAAKLDIISGTARFYISNQSATAFLTAVNTANSAFAPLAVNGSELILKTGDAERARIDSSGNLLVSKTVLDDGVAVGFISRTTGVTTSTVNSASINSWHLFNINATNNGYRFYVNSNGGIFNFSGNNVNLSDERTKKNIEVAGGYLEKICAIPVKLFNYKDEAEGEQRTLGVIAQDVEAVAPEFVNNDGWEGTAPEDGVPLKTIYTTDMMFGLMKAIQEQQAIIESLKTRIEALEGTQP